LTQLLSGLSPPPFVHPEEYDGLEFRWSILVFRPAYFKKEVALFAGLLLYIACFFIGKSINARKTKSWFDAHKSILEQQFSKPQGKSGLTADGFSDSFNFSTGRRNVASLHTIFTLRPRHDLFQWIFQIGRTLVDLQYRPKDDIQLDFKLSPDALSSDFVWSVVAKDELVAIKDSRWDLTFTKTSENPALSPGLSVMSEFADITENMLKPMGNFSISTFLNDARIQPYFRSLSVTDQPRERPEAPIPAERREKHVILSLSTPSNPSVTVDLVNAVFQLVDNLNKLNLRPETKTKLKKIREDLDKDLKEESEREKNEELSQAADDKKAAKRKAEEERVAKLSAAEQRKYLEKERKRSIRKSQGKVVRK